MVAVDEFLEYGALDGMLHALPVHVLCFDHDLICRYAAPWGPYFLGFSGKELCGQHVDSVFTDGVAMRPYLETVLHTNQPWHLERLPYPGGPNGEWPAGVWSVHAQPFDPPVRAPEGAPAAGSNKGRRRRFRLRLNPGVLVSFTDRGDHDAIAHEPTREPNGGASEFAAGGTAERRRAAMLLERIRTKLTVIRGFTQLLRRRIQRVQPGTEVAELTRITDAIGELETLLDRYEQSDRTGA